MSFTAPINQAFRRVPTWPVYVLGALPAAWFFYIGVTGGLGPDPIRALELELGRFALKLLIAVVAITPLRRLFNINLVRFRRALGLLVFFYVALHLLTWLVLDMNVLWGQILRDIAKRPYITIGMAGFAVMLPLALTSNDWSIRRLGPLRWRRLHRLTYLAILLGGVHFVMVRKGWQAEPLWYLAVILLLLALRLPAASPRRPARAG